MSTGIETWNMNLLDIGPMYPFAGTEMVLALIGIASWIVWHIMQFRSESKLLKEEEAFYSDKERLKKAMQVSNAETLTETLKTHVDGFEGRRK